MFPVCCCASTSNETNDRRTWIEGLETDRGSLGIEKERTNKEEDTDQERKRREAERTIIQHFRFSVCLWVAQPLANGSYSSCDWKGSFAPFNSIFSSFEEPFYS
jgi:hypothetical protein